MLAYAGVAGVMDKRQFIYDLENAAEDKLVMKDMFNTIDSTKLLWGLSKFMNRNLNPAFNADPASAIMNRHSLANVRSVQHKLPLAVIKEVIQDHRHTRKPSTLGSKLQPASLVQEIEPSQADSLRSLPAMEQPHVPVRMDGFRKRHTLENMSISLYSMASMDFYDQEYFESCILGYLKQKVTPQIDQLAFVAQACAILRRSEYTQVLEDWLVEALNNQIELNFFMPSREKWQLDKEKSMVSALQSVIFLMGDDEERLSAFKHKVEQSLGQMQKHLEVEVTGDHLLLIPSLLWSLNNLGMLSPTLCRKGLELIGEHMGNQRYISFPGAVLLNQVLNDLEIRALETSDGGLASILRALDDDSREKVQQLAYRFDQLEIKDNSALTKKLFGVDLPHEVVQSVKRAELD